MNRWILTAALLAGTATAAWTQVVREVPADVKPAHMTVTAPPEITLDGKADRLSPGARIRNTNNMLLLSGSVVGQSLPVVYRREPSGQVHEVWVVTEEEYSKLAASADGSSSGYKRFMELLGLIFGTR